MRLSVNFKSYHSKDQKGFENLETYTWYSVNHAVSIWRSWNKNAGFNPWHIWYSQIRIRNSWLRFDSIHLYNNFKELASAINNGKCPVLDVLGEGGMSHVMVATGIKNQNGIDYIQLKNSYADNPIEQGEVQKVIFKFGG